LTFCKFQNQPNFLCHIEFFSSLILATYYARGIAVLIHYVVKTVESSRGIRFYYTFIGNICAGGAPGAFALGSACESHTGLVGGGRPTVYSFN
jgi:hypothetical protein